ncbi:Hypothetical predicted protein [Pelobates cultripes]|uniref:Uncharacterized protein n=1 Tax=Pelobates cultripes TaxID=61616 RepID=A0AAD1TKF4_PELCU|nr:Hypothetical predicted protein [Pelobates cultripes]
MNAPHPNHQSGRGVCGCQTPSRDLIGELLPGGGNVLLEGINQMHTDQEGKEFNSHLHAEECILFQMSALKRKHLHIDSLRSV